MAEEDHYDEGVAYWQARYLNEPKPSDWILKYPDLQDILGGLLGGDRSLRVLHVGCGNSLLTEGMYDDGYRNLVNIDTSEVVIGQMRERNAEARPGMQWAVMDATATAYSDGSFDAVLDKALLDTLLCEGDDEGVLVARYFREMARVVRSPGGLLLLVSFGPPEERVHKVPHEFFDVETIEVPARGNKITGFHYVYACRRNGADAGDDIVRCHSCDQQVRGRQAPALGGPDLSSLAVVCSEPRVLLVPSFLPAASCAALAGLCLPGGGGGDAQTMLSADDPSLSEPERALVEAVEAAIGRLAGQPAHGEEPPLLPMLTPPHTEADPMLPAGLHVDNNGKCHRRFAAAILYLSSPVRGSTVFPLAQVPEPWAEHLEGLRVTGGHLAGQEAVAAGGHLVDAGIYHTKHCKTSEDAAAAERLLSSGAAGTGLAVEPRQGSLVVFWCRRSDGEVCPRSWHAGLRVGPGGEPKLILRKFKAMPQEVWDSGSEGIAAYVGRTRESPA